MLFFVWMVGILGFGVLKIDAESSKNLRTYNVDPTFSRWPDKANILYYIDPYYSVAEANAIRTAAKRVMDNLYGCVNFVETTASDARYKIHVSPYNEAGVLQTFCYTFPGQNNNLVNAGAKEQLMTITRGTYGCFDGTLHTLMKYFAIVLGKRNEHQRGDREDFIRVIGSNIVVPNSYRLYNISEAYWKQFPYDYCSITHNQQTDYASPGTVAFTVLQAPYTIPKLDSLSNTDCKLISMIYNCPTTPCTAAARNSCWLASEQSNQTVQFFKPASGEGDWFYINIWIFDH